MPSTARGQNTSTTAILAPAALAAPAAGQVIIDPTFGVAIRRLTDRGEQGGLATAEYPQLQAFNADETRLLLDSDVGRLVLDTATWQPTHQGFPLSLPRWSPTDPSRLIGFNRRSGGRIQVREVVLGANGAVTSTDGIDVTALGFEMIDYGAWEELSDDGRYMGLYGTRAGGGMAAAVLDLRTGTLGAVLPLANVDWVSVTPDGAYLVVQFVSCGTGPTDGLAVFDRVTGTLVGHASTHYSHGDIGRELSGREVFVTLGDPTLCVEATPRMTATPLPDGVELGMTRTLYERGGAAVGIYTSCRNARRPGFCVNADEWSAAGTRPFAGEIWLASLADARVLRLAHHRSRACSYFTQTRPTISPRGRWIAFTSDWARPNCDDQADTYVIDTTPFLAAWLRAPPSTDGGVSDGGSDGGVPSADGGVPSADGGVPSADAALGGDAASPGTDTGTVADAATADTGSPADGAFPAADVDLGADAAAPVPDASPIGDAAMTTADADSSADAAAPGADVDLSADAAASAADAELTADAAPPAADAGLTADAASAATDADAAADAGDARGQSGCGCGAARGAGSSLGPLLVLALVVSAGRPRSCRFAARRGRGRATGG